MNEAVKMREIINSNHGAFICLRSPLQVRPGRATVSGCGTDGSPEEPEQVITPFWSLLGFVCFVFLNAEEGVGRLISTGALIS